MDCYSRYRETYQYMSSSLKNKKTKKCQPAAGDMPDLIQTEHVPSRGLARPHKKINRTKKLKYTKKILQAIVCNSSQKVPYQQKSRKLKNIKTKKCQPAAGDMPDLIQTEHVPSRGLARPHKIINRTKKLINTKKTLQAISCDSSQNSLKNKKTKKCQPAAGDMPDLIQTEHVPSRGLARPHKKINRMEKFKIHKENTASYCL